MGTLGRILVELEDKFTNFRNLPKGGFSTTFLEHVAFFLMGGTSFLESLKESGNCSLYC